MRYILLLIVFCSCKTQNSPSPTKVVEDYLGTEYITVPNESKTCILYQTESNLKDRSFRYIIIKEDNAKTVVAKGTIANGYIKWINDSQIEYQELPEVLLNDKNENNKPKIININLEY